MTFMKKDVNLGLLVLIIASVLLFSGFSVYYQTAFKDVSLEYQEKLGQLSEVTEQLSSKRQELNETYSMRVKAEQDKQTLDAQKRPAHTVNLILSTVNAVVGDIFLRQRAPLIATRVSLDEIHEFRFAF